MDDMLTNLVALRDDDGEILEMGQITFCDLHESLIRRALIDRGFSEDITLTPEERAARIEVGEPDAFCYTKHHLVLQSLHIFGGERVMQCKGCPVCAFESVIEQTTDDVAVRMSRKN